LSATGFSNGKQNTGTRELKIGAPNGTKVGIISKVPIVLSHSNLSRCDHGYKLMPMAPFIITGRGSPDSRFRKVKYPYHIPVWQLNYSNHILKSYFSTWISWCFSKFQGETCPQMKNKHHSKQRSGRDVFVAQAIICPGIPFGYGSSTVLPKNYLMSNQHRTTRPPMFLFSPLLSA